MRTSQLERKAYCSFLFVLHMMLACAAGHASDKNPINSPDAPPSQSAVKTDTRIAQGTETATHNNPSVTLPPRSAVRFPGASEIIVNRAPPEPEAPQMEAIPRIPGAITTLTIQNTARFEQFSVPITFGQAFAQGDVQRADTLIARLPDGSTLPVQMDVKALYRDGSVKHALISLILPKLESAKAQYIGLMKIPRPSSPQNAITGKS